MTALLPIALGLLLQSTALLLLGLFALWLTRRRGPVIQSLVGRAALAGVALTLLAGAPLTGHVRSLWRVTLPAVSEPTRLTSSSPSRSGRASGKFNGDARLLDGAFLGRASLTKPPSDSPNKPNDHRLSSPSRFGKVAAPGAGVGSSFSHCLYAALAAAWGLGTALLLLWLGVCQCHLARLCRDARAVASGPAAEMVTVLTPRPPCLLVHPSVLSPFLAGLRRPAIFLPAAYETEFTPTALRAILAHELAHLARRDTAWTLAARLLCALLWPQLLLWVLCRRLEQIGEEACDQAVLAQDCPPRAYADCLLTLAERHPLGRRERALGAGVAPFRSSLGRRITRILAKGTHAVSTVTPRLRLTVAALAVAAALGGAFLVSSAPAQSPPLGTATVTPEQQRLKATRIQDARNLKDIGLALIQYTQDHDEFFPPAAHWMDALAPYLKDKTVLFDPYQPEARRYGYAFNRNCSERPLAAIAAPAETVFVSDSTLGTRNASDTGQSLRANPSGAAGIPGSNYLFVDGHVKWIRKAAQPSFAIKWDRRFLRMTPAHPSAGLPAGMHNPPPIISQGNLKARQELSAAVTRPDTELSNARFLAGLTPVQGPGVVVTLQDSKKRLPTMPSGMTPPNIIHDSDINQVVNELKAAGAEAIAVNDQRLVATSPIRVAGATIFINNTPMIPPFIVKAIGNPKTLAAAMRLKGGVADQLRYFDPMMFSVRTIGTMRLPSYFDLDTPRYAKPIPDDAQTRRQAIDFSKQGTTELKSLATRLDSENTHMEAKLTALRREDEWNHDQEAALGKASHTIAALQALDRQCALLQLRILLNTQGDQSASRRTDTDATQQALRALKSHRAQVAQTLPLQQERDFEAKSHYYLRQEMALGIAMLRIKVARQENRRQSMVIETRLETLTHDFLE